jgi:L-threonylcarbamoyladenylate synthase
VSAFLQALLGAIGVPLVSTSANRTGEPTPSQFAVLERLFGREVDALVDGGDHVGEASTIVDMTGDGPVVLRAGAISIDGPLR